MSPRPAKPAKGESPEQSRFCRYFGIGAAVVIVLAPVVAVVGLVWMIGHFW